MLEYSDFIKKNNKSNLNDLKEKFFSFVITIISFLCIIVLAFIIFFIIKESIPILKHIGIYDFVFGKVWRPLAFGVSESYGIFYIILSTIYTAMLSTFISLFIGIGFSIFLVFAANDFVRSFSLSLMDLIVAVPSVIYGFISCFNLLLNFLS